MDNLCESSKEFSTGRRRVRRSPRRLVDALFLSIVRVFVADAFVFVPLAIFSESNILFAQNSSLIVSHKTNLKPIFHHGGTTKSRHKECRHVGTDAARCGRYCFGCSVQVQYRKGVFGVVHFCAVFVFEMIPLMKIALVAPPQDVAAYIKKEFDKKHNPTWYVIAY